MSTRVTTLPNGFRVVSNHMAGLKSAALGLHVLAGSRHERADQNGIAHFLEHMAFKGTTTRTAQQISQEIENVGGALNAYTSREKTAFVARVLAQDVSLAVRLLADITINSEFASNELELERNVILNEIRQYQDYPEEMVFEGLFRTVFPEQPFGRSILGSAQLVQHYESRHLRDFTGEHYRPDRMILSAAGAVSHDELVALARSLFGELKPFRGERPEPCTYHSGEYRNTKSVEQAQFVLAFEAPPILHRDEPVARIYALTMGGGASSRLFAEARERRGLCYSISAQCIQNMDTGMFVVHAATGCNDLERLAECCASELRKSTTGLTDQEVERARTQIKVGILMAYETPMFRVERMSELLAVHGELRSIDESIARFESVTLAEVKSFAASMLGSQVPTLALYGPIGSAPDRESITSNLLA